MYPLYDDKRARGIIMCGDGLLNKAAAFRYDIQSICPMQTSDESRGEDEFC
jgi:hypothetical protein